MPADVRRRLCCQFAMGGVLGALLVATLFAADAPIVRLMLQSADPQLTNAVVSSCVVVYCAVGAALSGFLFIVNEEG